MLLPTAMVSWKNSSRSRCDEGAGALVVDLDADHGGGLARDRSGAPAGPGQLKALLDGGADPNEVQLDGSTALHLAALQ